MLSAIRRAWATIRRLLADPLAPTVVLSLILVLSLYARVLHLGQPCTSPCKAKDVHTLIFDENYYVNAARVIDHIEPARPTTVRLWGMTPTPSTLSWPSSPSPPASRSSATTPAAGASAAFSSPSSAWSRSTPWCAPPGVGPGWPSALWG
jgi:hypothetical protein